MARNAYACMTSDGEVRLFANRDDADAWEKRQPENVFFVSTVVVNGDRHWRGAYPADGVLFTAEDQSTPQLVAALAAE